MQQQNNNFSFKKGGKQLPGTGQNGQANIFTMAASIQQRQDRGYYESLYHFDADVELAEYSLPVRTTQEPVKTRGSKVASSAVNQQQMQAMQDGMEMDPEMIGEDPMEEMVEGMENEYGEEMDMEQINEEQAYGDDELNFGDLKQLFKADENKGKDHVAEARKANYISRGTFIWQLQNQIETGEQAISFFAKYGSSTPIKFIKCKRKPVTGAEFRPYDLVKVEEEDVDNPKSQEGEYFTISAQGVVHIHPYIKKGSGLEQVPSEFFTLAQWMHQSTLFNVLTSMDFFKYYLIGKVFRLWKGNVRYKTYNRTRQQLSKALIQTRPAFLNSFMDINKTLYEMKSKLTFQIPTNGKGYDIGEFCNDQKTQRDEIKSHYDTCITKIISEILSNLVKSVTDSRNLKEDEDFEGGSMGQPNKNKSMNVMKQEKKLKEKVMALAEKNYASLGTFIRLVDYMVVETQVTINQDSADTIITEMDKNDGTRKYQIQTQVTFASDNDGMVFDPGHTDFITNFEKILQDMQTVTEDQQRVVGHTDFHQFIHGLINESGPRYRTIVEHSEQYQESKQRIQEHINDDFKKLTKDVEPYKECREIDKFDREFNFEEWKQENVTLVPIKNELKKLDDWEKLISKKIKTSESAGLIQVQGRRLQGLLTKRVNQEQENIKSHLVDIAEHKLSQVRLALMNITTELNKTPNDLKTYVDFCAMVATSQNQVLNLAVEKKDLEEMKIQLQKSRAKDSSSMNQRIALIQQQLETLQNMFNDVDGLLEKASASKDEDKKSHEEDLENKIVEEQKKLGELVTQIKTSDVLLDASKQPKDALDLINKIKKNFDASQKKLSTFNLYQQTMKLPQSNIPEIEQFNEVYTMRHTIWNIREDFGTKSQQWYNDNFRDKDAEAIVEEVDARNTELLRLQKKMGFDTKDAVLDAARGEVAKVKDQKRLIESLGNKSLKPKHMTEIWGLLPDGHPGDPMVFTLDLMISKNIEQHIDRVEEIAGKAAGEAKIQEQIAEINETWSNLPFPIDNYRGMKDRFIINKDIEEVNQLLEDAQMIVGNCLGMRFVADIRAEVEEWEKKLSTISYVLDECIAFQRTWMYLENIFSAEDIQKQLPVDTKQFMLVDKFWKEYMGRVKKLPLVMEHCNNETYLQRFRGYNAQLEVISNHLNDYLETKRSAFPRFYFLSNDDLLEILSQTRNPQAVQPHLNKCFDAMVKVEFAPEQGSAEILAMLSAEGENVRFSESVWAQGPVEFWLGNLEKMMCKSLYDQQKVSLENYPEDGLQRNEWFFESPAQAILTVDQIKWTMGVTDAIEQIMKGKNKRALDDFLEFSLAQIEKMVGLVRTDLNKLQRNCMGALIVIDVHARTVVGNMIRSRVDNVFSFDWTKQLRYYWEVVGPDTGNEMDAYARQTNTRFRYSYEYLGNGPRLVITPLTDKCYMTLTGALHLFFGGAPQGPAGTGKTETTKDLAKALAVQCVVFNCSDGLGIGMMARFFSGLAQCGAWACFDEFNRIEIEVLSVIAQQMLTIQSAIRGRKKIFEFEGKEIPLNLRFGVFITMNPGYAGRTELPDNLKALFRPVSMMIPDYGLIAEIILVSEGFSTADTLSRKMVKLYALSSEQLSKQSHYDFGMRAVKSVLVMAGKLKREQPDTREDIVLIRAMKDSNIPKFIQDDLPLFAGIVSDLFPGVEVEETLYGSLEKAIQNQLRLIKYQVPKMFQGKIIQLIETMMVRHGIMLVGETGTGKTTVSYILGKALSEIHQNADPEDLVNPMYRTVHVDTLNPKAVTMGELFGETNPLTNEWTEGLVSQLVKQAVEALETDKAEWKRWINFDGPVDAGWIENMNTVLDDNKMLCLANGQRIKMPSTCTMMFEVQDLKIASPATVSRCGMVFLEPIQLGWTPLVETWKEVNEEKYPEDILTLIYNNIRDLIEKSLDIIKKHKLKEVIPSVKNNLVASTLRVFDSFMTEIDFTKNHGIADPKKALLTYICFSIIWSLGANLHDNSRKQFNDSIKPLFKKIFSEFPDGNIYDYGINLEEHRFEQWVDQVPAYVYNKDCSFFEILVPTADTTKYKFVLNQLINIGANVLITGETGVGKSVMSQEFLNTAPEHIVSASINFSGKTTTRNLQDGFEGNLEQKRKTLLGPPSGKKMTFFIDDVNMPAYDKYLSQPPCELLRQAIDQSGFYDTKKLIFKKIQDCSFICACAPPIGGRNPVTPRLFRHFNMVWVPELEDKSMKVIFKSILKGFLELDGGSGLSTFADPIITQTVALYKQTMAEFLPTPLKCHYTFNLRDLSKVVQGMLMINLHNLAEKEDLVYLWIHEVFRVFRDRLIDQKDRDKFSNLAHEKLTDGLDLSWELSEYNQILFGDYESNQGEYMKLSDVATLIPRLENQLDMHNTEQSPMNLVFFSDCIQHLTRICRVLRQERGNVLLVGVGGSGRRSMARLAAYMNEQKTTSIEIIKGYREKNFHEDIREMLRRAGVDNEKLIFLFSDTQIVVESFLEDINNLINSGEIPRLFAPEDKQAICEEIGPRAREAGQGDNRDMIYAYFVQICRDNLHIVLAFSPVGDLFRNRCRQFPSITNCCTIDWYNPWPADALHAVAHREYSASQDALGIGEHLDQLCLLSVEIHRSVSLATDAYLEELRRYNYTTPTSYLDLLKTYKSMLGEKRAIVPKEIEKYKNGLQKLADTKLMIDELQKKLVILLPQIDESKAETAKLVENLQVQQKDAQEQEKVVSVEAAEANKIYETVMGQKKECEDALAEAMPIYHKALGALKTLKKEDIDEVKNYKIVAPEVDKVFQAVCLLFGRKQNFDEAKKMMANPNQFLQDLQGYKADTMSEKMHKALQKFSRDPGLTPEILASKSGACKSICMFIRAMDNYVEVMKIIKPKQAALKEAEAGLKAAQDALATKQASLKKVKDFVAGLERDFNEKQRFLESLNTQKETTAVQLERADKLVNGLADESQRWVEAEERLGVELINLIGNMMISAGFVSYVGPFTAVYRSRLLEGWMKFAAEQKIPYSNDLTIKDQLGDPVVIREWEQNSLPADALSTENGIICAAASRWPLLIDPQSQGNKWIKRMEKDNNIQAIKPSNPKMLTIIENGCKMGYPVLLENIEESLDPSLNPIMEKNIKKDKGVWKIKLSAGWEDYSTDFKFQLTTKLGNPHYLPEVCIKVTLINFTVTPQGLEDQLLVDVVKYEQPELEEQRDQLVVQLSDFKKQKADLEAKILKLVAESGEDILDDEELIVTLDQSKQTSITINKKVEEAEKTAVIINDAREQYRTVAIRGSVLYFVISDIGSVNEMYQYSLEFFTRVFNMRLDKSKKSKELEERVSILLDDITEAFYNNICRGLFERHKLLYAYLNGTSILRRADAISAKEWQIYMRGSQTDFSENENPVDYIKDSEWKGILGLEEAHANFADLSKSLQNPSDAAIWREIYISEQPQTIKLPHEYEERCTQFQKLMIINILAQRKLMGAIAEFVRKELGNQYTVSPPYDLLGVYNDSYNTSPIIFVLTPGADPISDLITLAKAKGMENRFKYISLGQGQGPKAIKMINEGWMTGDWICLMNCHLFASWMGELEKIQESQDEGSMHPEYRLWLTSEPSKAFPVPVLQNGIKLTNEPPRGLRANLTRTYQDISEEEFSSCKKDAQFKKLLFALAYFHAVILERRKYGPIGWNIQYMWMMSDLEVSKRQVRMFLEEQELVPYAALNYIIAEVNYGGRVTDYKDIKLISALLRRYLCPEVMNDNYKLSKLDTYYAPPDGAYADTVSYIDQLPADEDPEVFGLHPNANIAYELLTVNNCVDTILSLQPRVASSGAEKSPEQITQDLAREILGRLPDLIDKEKPHPSILEVNDKGQPLSLNTFLNQEIDRFNALTGYMKGSLDMLIRAIDGTVVMSLDLEIMGRKFQDNKMPPRWEAPLGYPSLKPLSSWTDDLIKRLEFMANWWYNGAPDSFWVSAFFFPQGFMTAASQTYARKTQVPIDALKFSTHVRPYGPDAVAEVPEDGVNVHGLFLQGARWDYKRCIVEDSEPRVPIVGFPVCWLEPVSVEEDTIKGCYTCPLYKTSERKGELSTTGLSTNFIMDLNLPSEMPEDYWVRRGAALLCMTDD